MTAVDAVLQLHTGWEWLEATEGTWREGDLSFSREIDDLDSILEDAGSSFRVYRPKHCLIKRVDETIHAAVDKSIEEAPSNAADHLRAAWAAAYGIHPDPDKAYGQAVRAVEALACPLVTPRNARSTLGIVIRDLRSQLAQWQLKVTGSSGHPASIDRFIEMLDLLWKGQSRHAGNPSSRHQSQTEGEAAIHLAATIVQWLTLGILEKVPSSSP
ncbi:hypothetical protein J5X84_44160 [Streptosporangiaceae bacterium NEAU-GS5]|nr:hypothetical protein [Streptosporangiaceae bacterium NEAU-GS5]